MAITKVTWSLIDTQNIPASDIADKNSAINTANKYAGLFVWDTTNNRMMRADGDLNISPWWVIDGSTSVVPS